ncbi:MAG: M50 family metallopeptidase, partial [Acidobacteriaceae bacterium]
MSRLDLWSRQSRLIQSSVAYATALLITVTLHEFGHGTAAWLYGFHPMVYGLHEEDIAASQVRVAVIAAAGPLVSLVLGMVFLAIQKR